MPAWLIVTLVLAAPLVAIACLCVVAYQIERDDPHLIVPHLRRLRRYFHVRG